LLVKPIICTILTQSVDRRSDSNDYGNIYGTQMCDIVR